MMAKADRRISTKRENRIRSSFAWLTLRNVVMTSKMMKYAPGELVADKTNASLACFIMWLMRFFVIFYISQTSKLSLEILDFSIRKKIVRKKHRTRLSTSFMNMYVTYRTTSSQFEYRRIIAIALWYITLLFHPVSRVDSRNMIGRNSYIRTYNVIIFHSVIEN